MKEEIKVSAEKVTKTFTSANHRLPAIMKLIKLMQDGLYKPMLDHTHKMFFGEISEDLQSHEISIMMDIDNRPNQEIAQEWFWKLMQLDYILREKRVKNIEYWEKHNPYATKIINDLKSKI